jgi:hypothetical protein
MSLRILRVALLLIFSGLPIIASDPSWKGKEVILTRAGVKLEMPVLREDCAPDVRHRQRRDVHGAQGQG